MSEIKIYGDIDSASIFFLNSTVDPKPMGTVEASLKSDEDRIVIQRNDRFEPDGVTFRTLFKRLNPSRVCNRQGQELVSQLGYTTQQVIDYINEQANLQGVTGGDSSGTDLIGLDVCFELDDTSTTIMLSTGHEFGVNSIKAVPENGLISIKSKLGQLSHFKNLEHFRVCGKGGTQINGGLNDVVDYLNELFTVGAFETVVIRDPEATTIADVDGVDDTASGSGVNFIDPLGDDIGGATANNNNGAGFLSDAVINQAGEYFTFDIAGKATYGFGLVHTQQSYDDGLYSGNASHADPNNFLNAASYNSQHGGFQFSHWFHIGNAHASWTNYGANTSYNMGPAWYSHNTEFDQKEEWNANQPVKVKVGINAGGFITISTLSDDAGEWKLHARSSYPVPEGSEFRLGIKLSTTGARLRTQPKVHLLEEEAPTMYFRYIESPDGTFHYPLFATEEEANYYDEQNGGLGQSHTHVYQDDPTNTTWYMPETNSVHDGTFAPVTDLTLGEPGNYTEITSLTDSDLTPPQFQDTTITVDELSAVVYQLSPVDVDYVTTIGGIPNWQLQDGTTLTGTAPEVTGDNVSNPSDTTTVTVYRTRNGMTSQGTLTINITNLTAPVTPITGVTFEGGSPLMDSDICRAPELCRYLIL